MTGIHKKQGWQKPGFYLKKTNPRGFFGFYGFYWTFLGFINFFNSYIVSCFMIKLNNKWKMFQKPDMPQFKYMFQQVWTCWD